MTTPFPADALAALLPLVEVFQRLEVPYYVGGSIASSFYGAARSTMDVDLVAMLGAKHVPDLMESLHQDYYIDEKMIREAIQGHSCFNLIHLPTSYKVDVFVPKNRRYDREALRRRRNERLMDGTGTYDIYFCSPEDILLAKLEWYRLGNETSERQWNDIVNVLKYQQPLLDRDYLEREARELEVNDLLDRAWNQLEQEI
ncbi:MAG: hypothetical protein JXB10_06815 [Pirellulales bacterium]|nr:hypothetical protein [Pirellulales bacterium]